MTRMVTCPTIAKPRQTEAKRRTEALPTIQKNSIAPRNQLIETSAAVSRGRKQ